MLRRALQIGFALYLVMGLGGLIPTVSEALAGEAGDCSETEEPSCPEQGGGECPPLCDDCVCPCWMAPLIGSAPSSVLAIQPPHRLAHASGEVTHESPVRRGVFRPPRSV